MDTLTTTSTLPAIYVFVLPPAVDRQADDLSQIGELESEACAAFPEWIKNFPSIEPVEPEEFETIYQWFLA